MHKKILGSVLGLTLLAVPAIAAAQSVNLQDLAASAAQCINPAPGTDTTVTEKACSDLIQILSPIIARLSHRPTACTTNTLAAGAHLAVGQSINSCSGLYSLLVQGDGNVVLYHNTSNPATAVWSSNTGGSAVGMLAMQSDGNLVIYNTGNVALWASSLHGGTVGIPGTLYVQDDGTLVEKATDGRVLWSSGEQPSAVNPVISQVAPQPVSVGFPLTVYLLDGGTRGSIILTTSDGSRMWSTGYGTSASEPYGFATYNGSQLTFTVPSTIGGNGGGDSGHPYTSAIPITSGTYNLYVTSMITVNNIVTSNFGKSNVVPIQIVTPSTSVPTLSSITPSSGASGSSITLAGSDFDSSATVHFLGSGYATITSSSATSITATVPSLPTGAYSVVVGNGAGNSQAVSFTVTTSSNAPTITGVSPASISAGGSAQVAVTGTGFDPSSNFIEFGGLGAANNITSSNGGTQLSFSLSTAAFDPGTYPLMVRNNQTGLYSNPFTITLTAQQSQAPTALLSVGGFTNATANAGDTVHYAWNSTGAVSAKGTYTTDSSECGHTGTGPFAWSSGNTLNGVNDGTIQNCQAGHTYVITYTVTNAAGVSASATITVTVRASTTVSPPTATLIANSAHEATVAPGGTIIYSWTSSGGQSYTAKGHKIHMSGTGTRCSTYPDDWDAAGAIGGAGGVPNSGSWVANSLDPCFQAGDSFSVAYTVYQGLNKTGPFASQSVGVDVSGSCTTNTLAAGAHLAVGQSINSCSGLYSLLVQGDGNVVLYHNTSNPATAVWSSNTGGSAVGMLAMQSDGNLVIYNTGNVALWASSLHGGTVGIPGTLYVQDDGTLVVKAADGSVLWNSNMTTSMTNTSSQIAAAYEALKETLGRLQALIAGMAIR